MSRQSTVTATGDFHPQSKLVPREVRIQLDPTNEANMMGVTLVADIHYPSGRTVFAHQFFWSLPTAHADVSADADYIGCGGADCKAHYDHLLRAAEDCINDIRKREGLSG